MSALKLYPPPQTVLMIFGFFGSPSIFFAQPANLIVDTAVKHHRITASRVIEELIAGQHHTRMREKRPQQIKFACAQ